jgi:hypothetical protein
MLWTELGATIVIVIVAMAVILAKRFVHADNLGAVSDRWVARHRGDAS